MAAVLHGLILLLPSHFMMTDAPDAWQEPIVYLTLMAELPLPSPPTHPAPPLPLAEPPPAAPAPPEETVPLHRPLRLSARHPLKKMNKVEEAPAAPVPPDIAPRPEISGPEAAANAADPQKENRPPSVIHRPPPEYPSRARRNGWEGIVVVKALVDTAGRVHEARIAGKSDHEILDRAAVAGVRSWRFQPGQKDGQNAAMWVQIPVRFELE